jgi:Zn-dependent protease/predicted transcriptional regulator
MTRSFRIGRVFGIDIEIDYTWFIVFVIVFVLLSTGWFARHLPRASLGARGLIGFSTAVLFFASVLLHELAHSLVALRSGLKISGITLFIFGGVSKMTEEPKSAAVEFQMAVAGPAMSGVLCAVFLGLYFLVRAVPEIQVLGTMFYWLGMMNGMLAVFNLLPGFPLDGGRVLRAGIWGATRNLTDATRIASSFGQALGFLMIVFGIVSFMTGNFGGIWIGLIGWFLVQAAQSSYRQLILRQQLLGVPVSSVMTEQVEWVPADTTLDQVVHDHVMRHNHPAFPVLDDGQLLGLISLGDIRHVPRERWPYVTARDAVPPLTEAQTVRPDVDIWDALVKMTSGNMGRLLVSDSSGLRGIVTRTDIMRLLRRRIELGV